MSKNNKPIEQVVVHAIEPVAQYLVDETRRLEEKIDNTVSNDAKLLENYVDRVLQQ